MPSNFNKFRLFPISVSHEWSPDPFILFSYPLIRIIWLQLHRFVSLIRIHGGPVVWKLDFFIHGLFHKLLPKFLQNLIFIVCFEQNFKVFWVIFRMVYKMEGNLFFIFGIGWLEILSKLSNIFFGNRINNAVVYFCILHEIFFINYFSKFVIVICWICKYIDFLVLKSNFNRNLVLFPDFARVFQGLRAYELVILFILDCKFILFKKRLCVFDNSWEILL